MANVFTWQKVVLIDENMQKMKLMSLELIINKYLAVRNMKENE